MRFCESGPDIPESLLNSRTDGQVVFFCGAGISVDAGQPTFWRLTLDALDHLRVGRDTEIGRALRKARRIDSPTLAPPLDQVFGWLQAEYSNSAVERVVADILRRIPNGRSAHHDAILRLSSDSDGNPLVVTTNFDRLFEGVAPRLRRWLSPDLPDFKLVPNPSGIVYLHGRVPDKQPFLPEQSAFVLGAGDFGKAYLADGWATRFLQQLLDRRTVVLLGYSAGDPPVRYLLEGLNAAGGTEDRQIYAFDRGEPDDVRARWKAMGVTGIAFSEFQHLWDTLDVWANRSVSPAAWAASFMDLARQLPKALKPFERGQVAYFAKTSAGARAFGTAPEPPSAEWLLVFDQILRLGAVSRKYVSGEAFETYDPIELYGVDGDVRTATGGRADRVSPNLDVLSSNITDDSRVQSRVAGKAGQYAELPDRLLQIASWIGNVAHQPAALWWAVSQSSLHPSLILSIRNRMGQASMPKDMARLWTLGLMALTDPIEKNDFDLRWHRWRERQKADGWIASTIEGLRQLTAPRLSVRPTTLHQLVDFISDTDPETRTPFDLCWFQVKGTGRNEVKDIPDDMVPVVFRVLREGLERISDLQGEVAERFETDQLPAVVPDDRPGERYISGNGVGGDVLWAISLFGRLSVLSPKAARHEERAWYSWSSLIIVKLRVFAWTQDGISKIEDVADGLGRMSDACFWSMELSRELLHLLRKRWGEFNLEQRATIEARILRGVDGKGPVGEMRELSQIGGHLGWLEQNGCSLGAEATRVLADIRSRSDWLPAVEKSADSDVDGRSGSVAYNTDPGDLPTMTLAEAETFLANARSREFGALREDHPFVGYVKTTPRKALAYLTRRARKGPLPPAVWEQFMSSWPDTENQRLTMVCALRLYQLPEDTFLVLRVNIARWTTEALAFLRPVNRPLYWTLWDTLTRRVRGLGEAATMSTRDERAFFFFDQAPVPKSRKGREFASRGVIGILARDMLQKMIVDGPAKAHAIEKEAGVRLADALDFSGEGADHAALEIGSRLPLLYARHKAWTVRTILPGFSLDHPLAEAAWTGLFLGARLPQPSLFDALKPGFTRLFLKKPDWVAQGEFESIAAKIAVVAAKHGFNDHRYPSPEESHAILRQLSDEGRQSALEQVSAMLVSKASWREFGVPFFKTIWPQEQRFQTAGTSNALIRIAGQVPGEFPAVIETIIDWIQPDNRSSLYEFTFTSRGEEADPTSLCELYPEAVLRVLERVLPHPSNGVPYDLRNALDQIATALPELQSTRAWRKLDRYCK